MAAIVSADTVSRNVSGPIGHRAASRSLVAIEPSENNSPSANPPIYRTKAIIDCYTEPLVRIRRTPISAVLLHIFSIICAAGLLLAAVPATAQVSSGALTGRITDEQDAGVPAVVVEARNPDNGFVRTGTADSTGVYSLPALPVGDYVVTAQLPGFRSYEQRVTVNVGTTRTLDIRLTVAPVAETVRVAAPAAPLISTRSSSLGEIVDLDRIEGLPLNGRQFANLAATVPGVGLGFHSDQSKSAQYAPQISGGNGRNINYVVDGGDNTDDTVGGLLQQYPLESIREFNVITQRFDAEYGRSNGGVLDVVTKSGTNVVHGSGFTLLRNDALNAETLTEQITNVGKQDYQRYQYGGSLGGPIVRDRVHYFAAFERTQQDTKQAVDTLGTFPDQNGVFPILYRQNLFDTKVTFAPGRAHYLALRYGYEYNSQPTGAGLRTAHSSWATSTNTFHSLNASHNWMLSGSALNELVVQYSHFLNDIPATTAGPTLLFPNNVAGGTNVLAPSKTEQTKVQFRDDVSWTRSGFGVAHDIRAGVNLVHEPRLFAFTGQGTYGIFFFLGTDVNGPIMQVLKIGGNVSTNIPLDLIGTYAQDDWRVTNRLTVNLGVRYDYVAGMPINQDASPNFQAMQAAGRAGRFTGTVFEDFGTTPQADRNNVQPRLGAVYDLRGDGRDVIRGGWGIYTDLGYTNSNALTASFDAGGGAGIVFSAFSPTGILKSDGTLFRYTDPLSTIAYLNGISPNSPPTAGEVVSPRLQEPFSYQTNVGWSHELDRATAVSADYVRVQGRDLNMRVRADTVVNGQRYLGSVGVQPNNNNFRVALSAGRSEYNALILGARRRMYQHVDLDASYTLAKATSDVGSAYDELALNLIQDVTNPFSPVQQGPSARTDARHMMTASAIIDAPWQFRVAPVFMYHSALPLHTFEGVDLNRDTNLNDKTALAYRYTGLGANGVATYVEDGPCNTVNCSRRAPFSQMNLRVSRSFRLAGDARIEAIAEVFNLFNARNPYINLTTQRTRNGVPLPNFMQPVAYAGDVGQPEQRVGQIGFRLTF